MRIEHLKEKDYEKWDEFCFKNSGANFMHTTLWMDYAIDSSFSIKAEQASFIILEGNTILACMPLFIEEINYEKSLSYGGGDLLVPVLADSLGDSMKKKVLRMTFDYLDELAQKHSVKKVGMVIPHQSVSYISNVEKYNYLLEFGFLDKSRLTCIIDISLSEESIIRGFSKGHKGDIKLSGSKLNLEIISKDSLESSDVKDFMKYYFKIAGKITRPENTFNIIEKWIERDHGVLLKAYIEGVVCGYSLIYYYKDVGYYAMACKDIEYEKYNVSHFLQWEGIKYLKKKNIKFYDLGIQDFCDTLQHFVSEKDITISRFKRGFGGVITPIFAGEKFYDKRCFLDIYQGRLVDYAERNFKNTND